MATNPFISGYENTSEQNLLSDLTSECVQFLGVDCYYIPRTRVNFDHILGSDDQSSYESSHLLEFYIESFQGFAGDNSFMSKFGLEIKDQIYFTCSRDRFQEEITAVLPNIRRPLEGDLIFFPFNKKCFEIVYTDDKTDSFYPLGILPQFRVTVELFEYSSEVMQTGIPEIDALYQPHSLNLYDHSYMDVNSLPYSDEKGNILQVEEFDFAQIDIEADNHDILEHSETFVDWSETNVFGDISDA